MQKNNIEKSFVTRTKGQKPSKIIIKEGELVLFRVKHLSNAIDKVIKNSFHLFEGPFRVSKDLGQNAYVLTDPEDPNVVIGTYDRTNLRKYITP